MYKYQVEILVQSNEDFSTKHKSIEIHLSYEPNEEQLWQELENFFADRDYLLLEILDYYLVDVE